MRLPANKPCPIHPRDPHCVCRGDVKQKPPKYIYVHGVKRIPDLHHPRGYREHRSPAQMVDLLDRKIKAQNNRCAACNKLFTDYTLIDPDHIEPKGLGGAFRDDHPDNIRAVCRPCNSEKGSKRIHEHISFARPNLPDDPAVSDQAVTDEPAQALRRSAAEGISGVD